MSTVKKIQSFPNFRIANIQRFLTIIQINIKIIYPNY